MSAVHQTTSPGPASSQCSAWTRAAKVAAWVCPTPFGPPPRPRSRARTRRRARRCRASAPHLGMSLAIAGQSSTYTTVGRPAALDELDAPTRPCDHELRARARDADVERGGGEDSGRRHGDRADLDAGEHHLDPVRVLPDEHEHAVAGPARPVRAGAPPSGPAPSESWWNVRGSMTPSWPRNISAWRLRSSASTSMTSRVKLKPSGTRQRPVCEGGHQCSVDRARCLPDCGSLTAAERG